MKRDPAIVSRTMSRIRGKNTGIEMIVRKGLSARNIRYRLYSSKVYGHPDIVIEKYRIAIFCDSEFWHGYHFEEAKAKLDTNPDYWIPKIERNIARDKEVNERLKQEGYLVLRYWGHEIEKETERVLNEIEEVVKRRKEAYDKNRHIEEFTTLCYLEDDGRYLLLHRVKKKNDPNEGKWMGIGGHLEEGETPLQCAKREINEETGLIADKLVYKGQIDFLQLGRLSERMYLYLVPSFHGEMIECNEGDLAWVKKEEALSLPMWEGDRVFLPLLEKEGPRFKLSLLYQGDDLVDIIGPFYPGEKKKKQRAACRKTRKCKK